SKAEIHTIIEESGYQALKKDAALYKRAGMNADEALQSESIKQALRNGIAQTNGTFENITRTTVDAATMQYYDALDAAYLQVSSGAFDYNSAIKNAIKKLTDRGIATAEYASGHKDYVDTAVRRAVITGVNQSALHAQEILADELGCDLVEVTAHAGARTGKGVANHALWQGKVYSRSGNSDKYPSLREVTGYGTGAGLGGWNCRHSFYPFIDGVSERAYTDDELKDYNAVKYEYNGKSMTEYEARQTQRGIERQIRKYKREIAGFDAAGVDSTASKERLLKWQERQRDFTRQTGLKRDYAREAVGGYNGKKTVAKGEKSGIIELYKGKGLKVTSDSDISPKTVRQIEKAAKKVTNDFKVLESYSEPIVFGNVDGGLAENNYSPSTGLNTITLDKAAFADPDRLLERLH
ncbi:MAG: phage minor capsid protein, partial [Acutalibacteraceae bacterium]